MRTWRVHLLVFLLAVGTLFVVALSGCQSALHLSAAPGSCSEAQWEPVLPTAIAPSVVLPVVGPEFWIALAAAMILIVPATTFVPARTIRPCCRSGPGRSQPFFRDLFLPYLCAVRDP